MSVNGVDVEVETVKGVEEKLRGEGFKPFEVELGGRGVGVLEGLEQGLVEEFGKGIGEIASEHKGWKYWS